MGLDRPIDITTDQRKTLLALIKRHLPNTTAWVYGSRVKWTSRPQSDLDLVVFAKSDQERRVSDLREAFEESNLPFRVDLFVWDAVPEQFRKQIEAEHVVLVEKEARDMGDEWRETKLGHVIELKRGYDLPQYKRALGPVPVVSSSGQTDYHLESKVQGPGVVTGRYGTLGQVFFIPNNFWPLNTTLYVCDFKGNDPRFIGYFLQKLDFSAYSDKAAVPGLNRNHLHEEVVRIPTDVAEQRAIAHILGTLDDKIELNRRMNETLEAMARALFKSWFIDFDPVRAKAALRNHSPLEGESAKAPSGITPPLRGSRRDKGASTQMSRWGAIKRFYTQQTLQKAQTLRESQTNAEGLLWHYLRDKQLAGHKFRRQQPIGPYIVDFACMPKKLLIELDGGQHAEQHTYDKKRDEFLREKGYKILRFWNNDVFENCFGVLESIRAAVQDPPPQQSAPNGLTTATPPQGGSDWSVERARAYLDRMPQHLADLFPDRLVDSELGPIPEGWEVKTIDDLAEVTSGKRPGVRYGEPSDLAQVPLWGGNGPMGFVTEPLVEYPILLTGRVGTLGSIFRITSPCWPSDNTLILKVKDKRAFEFLFFQLKRIDFTSLNVGSTQPLVTQTNLKTQLLLFPPANVLEQFHTLAEIAYARLDESHSESRFLAALRDVLLPKLISGEIRIRDAETFLEQVR